MSGDFHPDSKMEPLVITFQIREGKLTEVGYFANIHLPSTQVHQINRWLPLSDSLRERVSSVMDEVIEAMLASEELEPHA